jgi:predicted N-acyltransferase
MSAISSTLRRFATPRTAARGTQGPSPRLVAHCADELDRVPAAMWDGLAGSGCAPLAHAYLRAWEHSELAGLRSRPVLAYTPDGALVGACPGYFYDLDIPTVRNPQAGGGVRAIRRVWPRFLIARTYELGSPTPLTNPFMVSDRKLRPLAVRTMITAALEEAERSGAEFTLVQNFTSRETPGGEELARLGFAGVPAPATAVVNLPYDSFEEYLASMRAQYRRRAQQALKRSSELTVEHLDDFSAVAGELARLWRLVYERATEIKREVLTVDYFRLLARVEGSSVLLTRRPDGSIAAFALLLDDQPWLSFLQCGFEHPAGRREGAYFRLLYEIVRFGIERGYEQVDLGITTLEPKLDVGGIPVPLFAWVRHRNPVIQRVLQTVADRVMNPASVAPRHVFKEPPAGAAELVARRGLPT